MTHSVSDVTHVFEADDAISDVRHVLVADDIYSQ